MYLNTIKVLNTVVNLQWESAHMLDSEFSPSIKVLNTVVNLQCESAHMLDSEFSPRIMVLTITYSGCQHICWIQSFRQGTGPRPRKEQDCRMNDVCVLVLIHKSNCTMTTCSSHSNCHGLQNGPSCYYIPKGQYNFLRCTYY